jgi:hypothetical protein
MGFFKDLFTGGVPDLFRSGADLTRDVLNRRSERTAKYHYLRGTLEDGIVDLNRTIKSIMRDPSIGRNPLPENRKLTEVRSFLNTQMYGKIKYLNKKQLAELENRWSFAEKMMRQLDHMRLAPPPKRPPRW